MTNADRIRQMTDEQLVEWLLNLEKSKGSLPEVIVPSENETFMGSYKGWLRYLQREVKS